MAEAGGVVADVPPAGAAPKRRTTRKAAPAEATAAPMPRRRPVAAAPKPRTTRRKAADTEA